MGKKVLYPAYPVLLVDGEVSWLNNLKFVLRNKAGITNILTCSDGQEVQKLLSIVAVSVVVLDYSLPTVDGGGILNLIKSRHPDIPVLMLTGRDQVEIAVDCMRSGAFDYFVKSIETERILAGIKRAVDFWEIQSENRRLREHYIEEPEISNPGAFSRIVTSSSKMKRLFGYIEAIASSSHPVLITGETGVGKELIAQAVHEASLLNGKFVAVNVGGLDGHMFTDTLFGHTRGAFTGASSGREGLISVASGGTLFLDEVGELDEESQIKLLRLIQEKEYFRLGSDLLHKSSARIIAATNRDFSKGEYGSFRKDLYYRLTVHQFAIPPLRERNGDIRLLVQHFSDTAAKELCRQLPEVSPRTMHVLESYNWPGNVRELKNLIYDMVATCRKARISPQDLPPNFAGTGGTVPVIEDKSENPLFSIFAHFPKLEEMEKYLIAEAMRMCGKNQSAAAKLLGMSRPTLCKRLKVQCSS